MKRLHKGELKSNCITSGYNLLIVIPDFFIGNADFTFEVRVLKEWDDKLGDKHSEAYKQLSTLLTKEVSKGAVCIVIISLRIRWFNFYGMGFLIFDRMLEEDSSCCSYW